MIGAHFLIALLLQNQLPSDTPPVVQPSRRERQQLQGGWIFWQSFRDRGLGQFTYGCSIHANRPGRTSIHLSWEAKREIVRNTSPNQSDALQVRETLNLSVHVPTAIDYDVQDGYFRVSVNGRLYELIGHFNSIRDFEGKRVAGVTTTISNPSFLEDLRDGTTITIEEPYYLWSMPSGPIRMFVAPSTGEPDFSREFSLNGSTIAIAALDTCVQNAREELGLSYDSPRIEPTQSILLQGNDDVEVTTFAPENMVNLYPTRWGPIEIGMTLGEAEERSGLRFEKSDTPREVVIEHCGDMCEIYDPIGGPVNVQLSVVSGLVESISLGGAMLDDTNIMYEGRITLGSSVDLLRQTYPELEDVSPSGDYSCPMQIDAATGTTFVINSLTNTVATIQIGAPWRGETWSGC